MARLTTSQKLRYFKGGTMRGGKKGRNPSNYMQVPRRGGKGTRHRSRFHGRKGRGR
jgi:hypothetical protein